MADETTAASQETPAPSVGPATVAGPRTEAPASASKAEQSAPQEQKRGAMSRWVTSLLGMGGMARPSDTPHDGASKSEEDAAGTADDPLADLAARVEALSDDELRELPRKSSKMGKLVQSETDRREERRRREDASKNPADAATLTRIEQLETQERQVRETDPYEAARLRTEVDQLRGGMQATQAQQQQLSGLVKRTVDLYDQHTLLPLLASLPEEARQAIVADVPAELNPLEGRQEIVKRYLKAFEQHVRADEAAKVRGAMARNPAERKQVVLGVREEEDEPDMVPTNGSSSAHGKTDMDTYIKSVLYPNRAPRRRR